MKTLPTRFTHFSLVVCLLLAVAGCGGTAERDSVTIMVPWMDSEFSAFYAVVKKFEAKDDIKVKFEVTRAQTQQLDAALAANNPPDLAVFSSPGAIAKYAARSLKRLDVESADAPNQANYFKPFQNLMMFHNHVYAVPIKADVKSLNWYNPRLGDPPPSRLRDLEARHARWCLGLEDGPTSGWPGADWIADILLTQQGAGTYQHWLDRNIPWSSRRSRPSPVQDAWTEWRKLVRGSIGQHGKPSVTAVAAAAEKMTSDHCQFSHGALGALQFPGKDDGMDYNYAPRSPTPLQVSGDFVGMFHRDDAAEKFIAYLSSVEAQTTWIKAGGFAFSADTRVMPAKYPRGVERSIAGLLRPKSHRTLCFSAADLMTPDLSAAFYRGVLDYVNGSQTLKQILNGLDRIQKADKPSLSNKEIGAACQTP